MDGNNGVIVDNTVQITKDRDSLGRFNKGYIPPTVDKLVHTGRKVGSKNKKTVVVGEVFEELLGTDGETGRKLSTKEKKIKLAKMIEESPRLQIQAFEYIHGKVPTEVVLAPKILRMPPAPEEIEEYLKSRGLKTVPAGDTVVHTVEGKDTTIDMVSEGGVEAVSPTHAIARAEESK